ncbi:MAG: PKD domain-containing protein [Bacteroidota bacterium]|nr:PKD domain-containing protein [Bacteroidota bacterium]
MKLGSLLIVFLFLIVDHVTLQAAHIIGGEMYYQCLGYGKNGSDTTTRRYRITIKLYRDCQGMGAQFDNPLGFTVYRKNGSRFDIIDLSPGGGSELSTNLDGPYLVAPPKYPCLVLPDNLCVEEGIYTAEVELPIVNTEYVVVWQRCCRNNSITNLEMPEATGATFTIEIHPEAQKTCNNSPRFVKFPPTVVCVSNPLKFDHSAFDEEGDLLIYDFCEPLAGGGRGQGGGNNCNNVSPNPDCPPPFQKVQFKAPFYTYNYPMSGNPKVTINTLTGEITGEPTELGQYVVGVCIYEYRNGILLSTSRRDFQFNVAVCEGTVVANLAGGISPKRKNFEFLLCGTSEYQFVNNSYQQNYIQNILWTYENGGVIENFDGWSPKIKFKEGGIHKGQFILNPGSNCSDTAFFTINVIPDLLADFDVRYDTCKAGPVSFKSKSSSSYSSILSHNWSFGDGFTGFNIDETVNYKRPGTYPIDLTIKDNFGCEQARSIDVAWFPAPNVIIFEPNIKEGCVPLSVSFKNISFPTDDSYAILWKFSDGKEERGTNITHVFDSIGSYHLKLEVISPIGCYNEASFADVVQVYLPPNAELLIDKTIVNAKDPLVTLKDISKGTIGRTWIIDPDDYYFDQELQIAFTDTGIYKIRMIVADRFLCTDTIESSVRVYRDFSLFMPNSFTPNSDGHNDEFKPVGQFFALEKFTLKIFDRWGGLVFQTNNPDLGWDGRFQNSSRDVPSGVYVYDLYYKVNRKEAISERKMLSLIR